MSKQKPWPGYLLASIGVAVLLFEVSLHFYGYFQGTDYQLNHPVLYVAMVIGFVGFYMINPKGAEGGTDILSRTIIGVISVIRTGKRADELRVEVTQTAETPVVLTPDKQVLTEEDAKKAAEALDARQREIAATEEVG